MSGEAKETFLFPGPEVKIREVRTHNGDVSDSAGASNEVDRLSLERPGPRSDSPSKRSRDCV